MRAPRRRSGETLMARLRRIARGSRASGRTPAHREEMRAHAEKGRLALDETQEAEQRLAVDGIVPARAEVGEDNARALDGEDVRAFEARLGHLGPELVGPVEERGREVPRVRRVVPVNAGAEV